jgi:hypothetical protein
MTWDARDLRKNVDPVPQELLDEQGVGHVDVGEKTPYNELLDEGWENYFGVDPIFSNSDPPPHAMRTYNELGFISDKQWARFKRFATRGIEPETGLDDPTYYS